MSNCCFNQTIIFGDSQALELFKADFREAISENPTKFTPVKSYWKNMWMGNLFLVVGYTEDDIDNNDDIHCRAGIDEYEIEDDRIILHYTSAWNPIYETLDILLREKYPGLRQVTMAEEPNEDVYVNTDKEGLFFKDRYLVDCCIVKDGEEEYYYEGFVTEDELVAFVNELYETSFKSFEEIEDAVGDINDAHDGMDEFFKCAEYSDE